MVPEGLTAMGSLDETAGKIKMGEFEWPTEHGKGPGGPEREIL
jgi:hypothetical protein